MPVEFYPVIALIAILVFFAAGSIIAKVSDAIFSSEFSNSSIFIKLFLGVYTVVPLYAVIKNCFDTSLLGVLAGMVLFLVLSKNGNNPYLSISDNKKYYSLAGVLVVFSVIWECIYFVKTNGNFRLPHYDISYYGYLSQYVGVNNSENAYGYVNLLNGITVSSFNLYHFFEFWTTNIFTQLGLNSSTAHILITQPIFYSLILLGLVDLLSVRNPVYLILIVFAASGFLLLNTNSELIIPVSDLKANIIRSPFSSFTRKVAPVLPVIILSFIYLKQQKYTLAICISGMIACINVIYIPFVLGGWGVFMLVKRFSIKSIVYNGLILSMPLILLTALFAYHLFTSSKDVLLFESESSFSVMTGVKYILGHTRLVIIFLPVIVLLFLFRKAAFRNVGDIVIYTVGGFIAAVALGFLMAGNHNAAQLSNVAGLSVVSILIMYLLSNLVNDEKRSAITFYSIAILGAIALFNNFIINFNQNRVNPNYSAEFVKEFNQLTQNRSSLGFYLKEDSKYEGPYGKQVNVDFKGFPLLYTQDTFYTVSLDPIFKDISEVKSHEFGYLKTSPLHRKKLEFPEKSDSVLIQEVLTENHITWGIVSENKELPVWISERQHQIIKDSNTGDKLIILE